MAKTFQPRTKLSTQLIEGEMVIHVGPEVLVASKSEPGVWWIVDGGRCSCPGFTYRNTCRHLAPALEAAEFDRKSCEPAVFSRTEWRNADGSCRHQVVGTAR